MNKLYLGDAENLIKDIPDNSIDLVLTDPPYGTGTYETDIEPSLELWREIRRCGSDLFAIFGYPKNLMSWSRYFEDLSLIGYIVWHKYNEPLVSPGLTRIHHDIAIWGKSLSQILAERVREPYSNDDSLSKFHNTAGVGKKKSLTERLAKDEGRNRNGRRCSDLWSIAAPGAGFNARLRKHPNEKPEEVIRRLILLLTEPNDIVLDPFMGSGVVPAMCKQLQRRYIGYEINRDYFEIAEERVRTVNISMIV